MKIAETMGVLHSFTWNYVRYANMEGFCRDSHIYNKKNFDHLIRVRLLQFKLKK